MRDYLATHHSDTFDKLGKGTGKAIMHATAGSIIGIGEIVLLPLDVLKIKRQTNPEAFRGRHSVSAATRIMKRMPTATAINNLALPLRR